MGLAVEPQRVELVADVVMVVDVALRLRAVGRDRAATREQSFQCRVPVAELIGLFEQALKVAADLDAAGAIEIAEVQVGMGDELEQRLTVEDPDDDRALARRDVRLVPERDADGRIVEPFDDLAHEPAVDALRAVPVRRDVRNRLIVGAGDAKGLGTCSLHSCNSPYDLPRAAYCASLR
jgi:hypothetical protein